LLVLENSEPALHAALERLAAKNADSKVEGRIADVRDRERMFNLFSEFRPDLVFHAAALKHVPILERDWEEGVKTNVFGSVIVADAAVAAGAEAMVMISTDKAIEAVSILGATKRFAEMYCQALDAELANRTDGKRSTRIVSVRFGNVLASNGSVVPKFKAQIEAGGPVTVTHPDMVRYFMTIREACDLVVTAATHALSAIDASVRIYVLNMGQPVKVLDLAERMIRLAGLEPGQDIEIVFTGVRPGERMSEILFAQEEATAEIGLPGILAAAPERPTIAAISSQLDLLEVAIAGRDHQKVVGILRQVATKLGQSDHVAPASTGEAVGSAS
jgi:O-antigen biosynthesis protein WbqV